MFLFIYFLHNVTNKQLPDEVFVISRISAEPKAKADNTLWDLDYLGITKTKFSKIYCFIIHYVVTYLLADN